MVLVDSDRIPRVPPYSGAVSCFFTISATGLSPCFAGLPIPFAYNDFLLFADSPTTPILRSVWALPLSLAATQGIDVSFSSFRYLDVSVP